MRSVEIVVPCYNYARFLGQCVQSAIQQDGVQVQVNIIDDCSSDDTPEIGRALAARYDNVHFRRHEINRGHIATYNEGIAALHGDYFLLLSADDYLLPGALKRAVDLMERRPDIAFVFGRALLMGDTGEAERLAPLAGQGAPTRVLGSKRFIQLSRARNIVPTPTAVVRTAVQLDAGGYRAELPHTGDMEMWFRLAARGAVGYINADQAVYRQHGTNMSAGYIGMDDLHARRSALETFFADSISRIDASGGLRRQCLHRFSAEAFRHASMALNRGELAAARRFRDYGLANSPTARLSLDWLKLAAKQVVRRQFLSADF